MIIQSTQLTKVSTSNLCGRNARQRSNGLRCVFTAQRKLRLSHCIANLLSQGSTWTRRPAGQQAILSHFYDVVDGGRSLDEIKAIINKRAISSGDGKLTELEWHTLCERLQAKYHQSPCELWDNGPGKSLASPLPPEHSKSMMRKVRTAEELALMNIQRLGGGALRGRIT